MPRRRAVPQAHLEALLALPTDEVDLVRYYTLSSADLAVVARRRRAHNRLGFAVQLCALRYPGRLLHPGEVVPQEILAFVADQLDLPPDALADYAIRSQTRYDQLNALYTVYGFRTFTRPVRVEMARWLLPPALATISGATLAGVLLEELRRRAVAAPGPTVVERLVAGALSQAKNHVERQIDTGLDDRQRIALDTLLEVPAQAVLSPLAWTRQPPGPAGHRALAQLVGQLDRLRSLRLDPMSLDGIQTDRRRALSREGMRLSAQHLKSLSPLRRRAILTVTVLESITRLTDEAIGMFDRLVGGLFRRAERRAAEELQTNARAVNDKVRLLVKVGNALIEARDTHGDAFAAIEAVIPWDDFRLAIAQADRLSRPDGPDYAALAAASISLLRRIGPLFLDSFRFDGIASAASLLRAVDTMRVFYGGSRRKLPNNLPTGFVRPSWRNAVLRAESIDAAAYELCLFAELRDRLRAGDVWVAGSRQYRAVEDQLIPKALFTSMRQAGPLPLAVPGDPSVYLQSRKALLEERLDHVEQRAGRNLLANVRVTGTALRITPPHAATPEAAEDLAERIQALMPRVRITDLMAEVARWTDLCDCLTHLRTGLPAQDRRIVLTAVLADATNLGLTRMAEACALTSYRQLAWTAGWHLNEENYGRALAKVVTAQHRQALSVAFGSAAVSSSDGQHFPLGGPGEVAGTVNPHKGSHPAVSFYTFVSGRYAPFHTKVISATEGEAAHVVDGLLYHGGDIDIAIHHTDGGGVSDHVFALCHLLGFRFAPRIPNLSDRRLHAFAPASRWPTLERFFAGRIDEPLIATHWDALLRLATSVATTYGRTTQGSRPMASVPLAGSRMRSPMFSLCPLSVVWCPFYVGSPLRCRQAVKRWAGRSDALADRFQDDREIRLAVVAMEVVHPRHWEKAVVARPTENFREPRMDIHKNARTTPHSRRLMIERLAAGWSVMAVAEAQGVSCRTVRKWRDRFARHGMDGLADRSSRPHRSPRRLPAEVEAQIETLRRQRMTGPAIARSLGRPVSTVGVVLRRRGLGRLAALEPRTPVIRYERERPGELIHMDTKKLGRIDGIGHRITGHHVGMVRNRGIGWDHLHVAVDDASRLAYTELLPDDRKPSAIGFLQRSLAWFAAHGVTVERVMTDNGSAYRSRDFREVIAAANLRHIRTRPYTGSFAVGGEIIP